MGNYVELRGKNGKKPLTIYPRAKAIALEIIAQMMNCIDMNLLSAILLQNDI